MGACASSSHADDCSGVADNQADTKSARPLKALTEPLAVSDGADISDIRRRASVSGGLPSVRLSALTVEQAEDNTPSATTRSTAVSGHTTPNASRRASQVAASNSEPIQVIITPHNNDSIKAQTINSQTHSTSADTPTSASSKAVPTTAKSTFLSSLNERRRMFQQSNFVQILQKSHVKTAQIPSALSNKTAATASAVPLRLTEAALVETLRSIGSSYLVGIAVLTSHTRCQNAFIGGGNSESKRLSKRMSSDGHLPSSVPSSPCPHLVCSSCHFDVVSFNHVRWSDSLVSRKLVETSYPHVARFRSAFISAPNNRAYACQCQWTDVAQPTVIIRAKTTEGLTWECAGHEHIISA